MGLSEYFRNLRKRKQTPHNLRDILTAFLMKKRFCGVGKQKKILCPKHSEPSGSQKTRLPIFKISSTLIQCNEIIAPELMKYQPVK